MREQQAVLSHILHNMHRQPCLPKKVGMLAEVNLIQCLHAVMKVLSDAVLEFCTAKFRLLFMPSFLFTLAKP